jgi:RNA polymerase sigma factor (sigma-70 family)
MDPTTKSAPEIDPRPALAADLDGAFPALVEAEAGRLYSIALRLTGRPADAEDLAQEALVRAYRALGQWDGQRIRDLAIRPWLASIVLNLARNRARSRLSRPVTISLADELAHPPVPSRDTPHATFERREAAEAWATRLLALPERYRAPLVLRHVDGLSYEEIGEVLGRPAGTVKAQVHRGIAQLRTALLVEQAPADHAPADPVPADQILSSQRAVPVPPTAEPARRPLEVAP